jgi:RHS repeat-associated protein
VEVSEGGQAGWTLAPSAGTGSATTSGSEKSTSGSGGGTPGTGSFAITGTEQTTTVDYCSPPYDYNGDPPCPQTDYDSGFVGVTVNAVTSVTWYDEDSTPASVASGLAGAINGTSSMPVTATATGSTVSLTSKQNGTSTNYNVSVFGVSDDSNFYYPSYYPSPSSWSSSLEEMVENFSLTGGTSGGLTYDTGTAWVTVNGFQASVSYGQSSTAQSIATALGTALSASGTPVTASVSGTTISLNATATGSSSNYSLSSGSSTSQPSLFSSPSFSVSVSGSALTGGANGINGSDGSGAPLTMYTYNAADKLIRVQQQGATTDTTQWRIRTFNYDSLSRLVAAVQPESGTTTYTYDANGNTLTKTAPAPNQAGSVTVTTTYTYDQLNRQLTETYSNGNPSITYSYDQSSCLGQSSCSNIDKQTNMTDAAGSQAWSYDAMEQPIADQRTTGGVTKTSTYAYNYDGSVSGLTYPSGDALSYAYDEAGQPLSVTDTTHSISYGSSATYAPHGNLSTFVNGSNIKSTFYYNSRLQPCRVAVNSSGTVPGSCTDSNTGNVLDFTYNFNLGTGDNGNVYRIVNNRSTDRSITFTYDSLNRISAAWTDGNHWGESYQIDAWGNLNGISAYASKPQVDNLSQLAGNQNQFAGMSYDAAGNLLYDGLSNYTYNAAGEITTAAGVNYTYDGDGKRVEKSSGKLYWYGATGQVLDETDASGNVTDEYVYFGGSRIARRDASGNVDYYFADRLGTARVVTNSGGTILDDSDYCPFGRECYEALTDSSGNTYKFTGKERDSESGLDNFGARYNSSSLGRFMSPDPMRSFDQSDPQKLNRYSYGRNNPLSNVDVGGQCVAPVLGPGQVGICIESYIQAARVGLFDTGIGDGRRPVANDPKATFRTQTLIVATLATHHLSMQSSAGSSAVFLRGFDAKPGIVIATPDSASVDSKGDIILSLSIEGLNGQALAGNSLAPQGWIGMQFTLKITPDGKVKLVSGSTKKFPSISIFAYAPDAAPDDVWEQTESNDYHDLDKPMTPINLTGPGEKVTAHPFQDEEEDMCENGNIAACGELNGN